MKKEKRYVATFTAYVYARDDQHAKSKAEMIANRQDEKYGGRWCLEELHSAPFGSLMTTKIL
jgi:hypothetical protein